MSLTSLLKGKKDQDRLVQQILRNIIPAKSDFYTLSGKDPFSSKYVIRAPYQLDKPYDSSVVGTAFDYLARFIIAQKIKDYRLSVLEKLNASRGLDIVHAYFPSNIRKKVQGKYEQGIKKVRGFIMNHSYSISEVVPYASFLARLEIIMRSGMLPKDVQASLLDDENEKIICDLENLCDVFYKVFIKSNVITPDSTVIFNPHFGLASRSCGGADADIFIDGTLYDFKTSKSSGYKWQDVAQLLGYYCLDNIAKKISDQRSSLYKHKIERVALYKARFGELEYIDLSYMNRENVDEAVIKLQDALYVSNFKEEVNESYNPVNQKKRQNYLGFF